MKKLRSSEDLDSYGEKNLGKDSVSNRTSSSSHRAFYYTSERKGLSSSSSSGRYDRDRSVDDDRESMRVVRKRSDHDFEGFDRRKGFDRYRDSSAAGESRGYGGGSGAKRIGIHRSESFSGTRREFAKGFRSERDRPRHEVSVSSWRRFGSGSKDFDEGVRSRGGMEEKGSLRSSPRVLREAKSPTWSKDSSSEQSRVRASPPPVSRGLGDGKSKSKSPTRSRDSESEQSKSVEVKKGEDIQVESGNSSEREEGELEPETVDEAEVEVEPESKPEECTGSDNDHGEVESKSQSNDMNEDAIEKSEPCEKEDVDLSKESICEEADLEKEAVKPVPECQDESVDERGVSKDEKGVVADDGVKVEEALRGDGLCNVEAAEDMIVEKSMQLEEDCKQGNGIDIEVKEENVVESTMNREVVGEKEGSKDELMINVEQSLIQNFKDKGKSVALLHFNVVDCSQDGVLTERESRDVEAFKDNDMEGPSTRAFDLFSSSPVRRKGKESRYGDIKPKDEKMALEPLDLSLSLPNVLLPIGGLGDSTHAPGSPSHARSVQSLTSTFRSDSDGFTASMSFSGSQSFFHNPSCSLTQNSMDNFEQSVGSRPIFQGIDQVSQGTSVKEVPLYQRILMNSNGSLQQQSQAIQGHQPLREGSPKLANGLDRHLSFQKQFSGQSKYNDDVKSPAQSVGSHDVGANYSLEKKQLMREKSSGSLYRGGSSLKEQERSLKGATNFVEMVIARIVSESVNEVAAKFNEMTEQSIACVKESIREILSNPERRGQLYTLQKALQKRSDISSEELQKAHRAQLEIMVGLKTCLPDFLKHDVCISSSDLAEIFLNLRCKNLTCKTPLPVDDCDCKVCSQRNGFCSACMCLVCSNFDMESNTCSWIGCDSCLHWCHAECGLRESYIRNGRSDSTGPQGTTEMQFHCVACDQPSEMFGFVKEVFHNFAKDWSADTFSRELKYVKRIFFASKDLRGKQLCQLADQLLERLGNKSNLPEVYGIIMAYLIDGDSSKLSKAPFSSSGKERANVPETPWLKSIYGEKIPQPDKQPSRLPSFNYNQNDKRVMEPELQTSSQRDPLFHELDSIVRIKLEEAKMFQARADDARREAEGLKRISVAKNEKIEEEYKARISKLRLGEADEMRKQKIEELQALERAHREYSTMKMRMETDITELLLKMEATKRNLA